MDMEQLLCPQVCMDVEETPLELNNSTANDHNTDNDSDDGDIPEDVKIKLLLEVENFDPCQTPEKLTQEEENAKKSLFETGPLVQFLKLHCTACNVHLGSAPINQFNRYIHPILQVLLCKSCYDFYTSGDFEKDEDGSELYCRWCGQGGKVMCCSKCCFVFCQKCTRHNLGKKTLDIIKNSEDWVCFSCDPKQLIQLKVTCTTLFDYIQELITEAKKTKNDALLKEDKSLCCKNQKSSYKSMKRKRSSSDDATFDPTFYLESLTKPEPKKKTSILNSVLTTLNKPTVSSIPQNPLSLTTPQWRPRPQPNFSKNLMRPFHPRPPQLIRYRAVAPQVSAVPKQPIVLSTSTSQPVTVNSVQGRAMAVPHCSQNHMQPAKTFRVVSTSQLQTNPRMNGPVVNLNKNIANLEPGLKHNWFDQAARNTKHITTNLNNKIGNIAAEQKNALTIEELAAAHNKLQELISSSVNSLIQVRKTLRTDFLSSLNKLKFQKTNNKPVFVSRPSSGAVDDVVLVRNMEDPLKIVTTSSLVENCPPKSYIKVKPFSSLLDENHLKIHKMLGQNELIDLCDDDDDEIKPSISSLHNNHNPIKIHKDTPDVKNDVLNISDEKDCSDSIVIKDPNQISNNQDENNEEPTNQNDSIEKDADLDSETYRQIQRALAESKFEAIVAENSAIKVSDPELTEKEIMRMLTVRLEINPNKREPLKNNPQNISTDNDLEDSFEEDIVPQDFEEILSGSIVINTAKQKFGDIFSNFITKTKSCDTDSKVNLENDESNKNIKTLQKSSENDLDSLSNKNLGSVIVSIDNSTINAFKNKENNAVIDNVTSVKDLEDVEKSVSKESNIEQVHESVISESIENKKGSDINEDSCFFSEDGIDAIISTESESQDRSENLNDQIGTRDSGIE